MTIGSRKRDWPPQRGHAFSAGLPVSSARARTMAWRRLAAAAAMFARRLARASAVDRKHFMRFRIASQMRTLRER
jgi:hypothetical protein